MQAPYVYKENGTYYLFYGDWKRICLATSKDGKHFERYKGSNGEPALFTEHKGDTSNTNNARDAMVIKRGNTYYCYYTSHLGDPVNDGSGYFRSSLDMINWTESAVVSHTAPYHGNSPRYSDECPHVVYLPEHNLYYLFVTQLYGKNSQTTVYASPTPVYFGIDDELRKVCTLPLAAPEIVEYNGKHYIFCLTNELDGIKMAEISWE
jgi:sucrose-6-phosphate hydrolase SacC (GH32 family)